MQTCSLQARPPLPQRAPPSPLLSCPGRGGGDRKAPQTACSEAAPRAPGPPVLSRQGPEGKEGRSRALLGSKLQQQRAWLWEGRRQDRDGTGTRTVAEGSVGSAGPGWLGSAPRLPSPGALERPQLSLPPARAVTSLLLPDVGWVWSPNTQAGHGTGQQTDLLGTVASSSRPLAAPPWPPVQAEPQLHGPRAPPLLRAAAGRTRSEHGL